MVGDTISIVLAGGVGSRLHPLTAERAKPAVPFGGKYRIIDFALSNCLHSGLRRILVLTQYKSHSLFKHLRDGWSLFNPSIGEYLSVVPPQMRTGSSWYAGTADAVFQNLYLLRRSGAETVMLLSGDHIYRMDYEAMLDFHRQQNGGATVACMKVPLEEASAFGVLSVDQAGRIIKFAEKPSRPQALASDRGSALVSMGVYAFSLETLCDVLEDDAKRLDSSHDFGRDILPRLIRSHRVFCYEFGGQHGRVTSDRYWRDVGTLDSYYEANMELLANEPKIDLYQRDWPIYSTSLQAPPARVESCPSTKQLGTCDNVMLGPGTAVRGANITNSILAANIHVEPGASIKDSVIFDDVTIGAGTQLERCIIDKNVDIPPRTRIGHDPYADSKRFVISERGIVVVPRGYSFSSSTPAAKPERCFDPPIRVSGKSAPLPLGEPG